MLRSAVSQIEHGQISPSVVMETYIMLCSYGPEQAKSRPSAPTHAAQGCGPSGLTDGAQPPCMSATLNMRVGLSHQRLPLHLRLP